MKSILPLLVGLVIGTSAAAQITLTAATHTPAVGQNLTYINEASTSIPIGPSGANQVWDLSSVSGSSLTNTSITLANSSKPDSFPDATVVWKDGNNNEQYFKADATGLVDLGFYIPGQAFIKYSDGREYLKYPMAYGDDQTTPYTGLLTTGTSQSIERGGTVRIIADAYGDLVLPYGTVKNVLRVLQIAEYQDIFNGVPIYQYTDSFSLWYNQGNDIFIGFVAKVYANGSLFTSSASYIDQGSLLSIQAGDIYNSPYSFYPNPASEGVHFANPTQEKVSIQVFNVSGALQFSESQIEDGYYIDFTSLPAGTYFIKCTDSQNSYVQQLTKQ